MSTKMVLFDKSIEGEYSDTIWGQRAEEPTYLYQFFVQYFLQAPPLRTLEKAIELYHKDFPDPEDREIPKSLVTAAYKQWDWKIRAEEFDKHLRDEGEQVYVERFKELREREWQTSSKALDIIEHSLNVYLEQAKEGKLRPLSPGAMEKLWSIANKVSRQAVNKDETARRVEGDIATKAQINIDNRSIEINDPETVRKHLTDKMKTSFIVEGEFDEAS